MPREPGRFGTPRVVGPVPRQVPEFGVVDASETDPAWSTFWALNVDPQAYTFTADVGGGSTAEITTPALVADEWTVVVTLFHSDDFPQNPTPENCAP